MHTLPSFTSNEKYNENTKRTNNKRTQTKSRKTNRKRKMSLQRRLLHIKKETLLYPKRNSRTSRGREEHRRYGKIFKS